MPEMWWSSISETSAPLFSKAGIGNKPEGISAQSKTIGIKCTNVEANAMLTMRVEAEKVSGSTLVSDNADVGFVIANSNGVPLTPNNLTSKIPFRLDDSAQAQVGIRAWPVSVTGKKPAEGVLPLAAIYASTMTKEQVCETECGI